VVLVMISMLLLAGLAVAHAPHLRLLRQRLARYALELHVQMGGSASLGRGPKVPPQFLCPITGEVMREPVTTADGHAFERRAIERWLLTHSSSPMTGAPLPHKQLAPALALRQLIDVQLPLSVPTSQ